jgi:hypothetical protein
MIINLDKATAIVVSGSRVQVHFRDTSVHLRSFKSRRELAAILDDWGAQTRVLRPPAQTNQAPVAAAS